MTIIISGHHQCPSPGAIRGNHLVPVGAAEAKLEQPLNGRARHGARLRRVTKLEQRRSARDDARQRERLLVRDG